MSISQSQFAETPLLRVRVPAPDIREFYLIVRDQTSIGRHPNNDIPIPRNTISRFHAKITQQKGQYILQDLQSSNGTFVNEKKISKHTLLQDQDQIRLGEISFTFHREEQNTKSKNPASQTSFRLQAPNETPNEEVLHTHQVPQPGEALQSIESIESLEEAGRYLRAHYQFIDLIRQQPSQQNILQGFLELVVPAVQADRGMIVLGEPENMRPHAAYLPKAQNEHTEFAISQTILDRCVTEKVGILSRNAQDDARFSAADSVMLQKIHSAICAPLLIGDRIFGVAYLDAQQSFRQFTQSNLACLTNLTAQLALALENIRIHNERRQAEQLAVIGRTMAEVSHSIKNILSITQSGAEILQRHLQARKIEAAIKTWKTVCNGMERMNNLATAMLDFSRTTEWKKQNIDINQAVLEIYETYQPDLEKRGIETSLTLEDALPPAWADKEGLHDAILNLIVNARDALEETNHPRIILKTETSDSDSISISVQDNGPGIPEDLQQKIFQPFFTTKGAAGNGLGLASIYQFAREMAGQVEMQTQEGQGTTFQIILPIAKNKSEEAPQ